LINRASYGIDSRELNYFEGNEGFIYSRPSGLALKFIQPTIKWVRGSFSKSKATGAGRWPLTYSSVDVKKEWRYTSTPPCAFWCSQEQIYIIQAELVIFYRTG
jgi:hypothetical protein